MPRRTDSRQRMVAAARDLMRERGLTSTAISDVLERSGAPRGSVYFHFPEGKTQLVVEAAGLHAEDQVTRIDAIADASGTAAEFVGAYVDSGRDGMVAAGYARGCAVAPLVNEGSAEPEAVVTASRVGFERMVGRLAERLTDFGLAPRDARELAEATVAGVEGAMITSRAFRSPTPFDAVRTTLVPRAESLTSTTRD
jgi:TetR/AcrR family transcriptional regulator, lmrAB and yxaGH operons repressor